MSSKLYSSGRQVGERADVHSDGFRFVAAKVSFYPDPLGLVFFMALHGEGEHCDDFIRQMNEELGDPLEGLRVVDLEPWLQEPGTRYFLWDLNQGTKQTSNN